MATRWQSVSRAIDSAEQAQSNLYPDDSKLPSQSRSRSYERRRPAHRRGRRREKAESSANPISDDSDDEFIYKVDRYGRRYRHHARRGSYSRDRHEDRLGGYPQMSGALPAETPRSLRSSSSEARAEFDAPHNRWSTSAAPFRDKVRDPQRRNDVHCHCQRCREGRPGCRYNNINWIARNDRSRSPGLSNSLSTKPKGILKRPSSESINNPRLRKTVSFEKGTKVPLDCEDDMTGRSDDEIRRMRNRLEHVGVRPASSVHDKHSRVGDIPSVSNPIRPMREWVSKKNDNHPRSSTKWKLGPERYGDSRGASSSDPCGGPIESDPRRAESTMPSQDDRLVSIAHSVLLSTHQSWCNGGCGHRAKFARRMGACRACRRRPQNARPTPGARPTPHCRTLIHCVKFGEDFLDERVHWIWGSNINRAIRLGYAEAYSCEMAAYLTMEEYIAYQTQQIDNLDLALWLRDEGIQEQISRVRVHGVAAVGVRTMGPAQRFLVGLAEEVEKTKELWANIIRSARESDRPLSEARVLNVVEDMIRGWRPKWVREEDE